MSRKIDTDPSYLTVSNPVVTAYPFTVNAWMLPNTVTQRQFLFYSANDVVDGNYWGMRITTGDVALCAVNTAGSGETNVVTTNTVTNNAWNMATMVFTSATSRKIVLNGDFANEGVDTVSKAAPVGLVNTALGAFLQPSPNERFSFIDFLLAHVAVWDVALTDDEVTALNRGAFPHEVRPSALLAHWPLWGNHDPEIVFGPKAADGFQMSLVSAPAKGNHKAAKLWTPRRQFISTPEALFWSVLVDQKAHYKLNDDAANTTVEDSSENSNTGTLEGGDNTADVSVTGKINKAFGLNGTDDCVNIDTILGDVSSDTAGTIAAWVKPTTALQNGHILTFGDTDAVELIQFRMNTDGTLRSSVSVAGVTQYVLVTDSPALSVGTYTHVMVVHNGTQATLYADNVAVAQTFSIDVDRTKWLSSTTGVDNVRIGCANSNSGGNNNFLRAEVDDIRYISRALTELERAIIFNDGNGTEASVTFIPTWNVSADQKGHYKLNDDDPNTIVTDSSGNSNTGALEGGDNTSTLSQDPGKINKSFLFNGTDDQINIDTIVGDVSSDTTGSLTAWIKPTSGLQTGQIVSFADTDANEVLQFRMNSDGKLRSNITVASSTRWTLVTDNVVLTAGVWTHVMVIHNGTQATLYVDNVAVAQSFTADLDRVPWISAMTGFDTARIGSSNANSTGGSSFLKAQLDDVRIFNRVLTDLERAIIYNDGHGTESSSNILTPDWDVSAAQKAHYKLNDVGNDTTVTDSSGTSNDGTLEGGDNTSTISQDPGKISKSLLLNGTDDFINIDTVVGDVASDTAGTWAVWVKLVDATVDRKRIIAFGDTNANEFISLDTGLSAGKLRAAATKAGTVQWLLVTDNAVFSDNTWTHIMLVHDGVEAVIYIDNVKVAQTFSITTSKIDWFSSLTGLDNGRIGCLNQNSAGDTFFFNSQFDDVRYINRALTELERTAIFNNGNGTELNSGYL